MSVKSKYSKGRLKFYSGAVDDESVGASTAPSTGISNYGVTLIHTATTEGTWTIDAPVLGAHKTIIVANTTCYVHIKTTPASMNVSGYDVLNITNNASTMQPELGVGIDLYGASTVLWYMRIGSVNMDTSSVPLAAAIVLGATT